MIGFILGSDVPSSRGQLCTWQRRSEFPGAPLYSMASSRFLRIGFDLDGAATGSSTRVVPDDHRKNELFYFRNSRNANIIFLKYRNQDAKNN